jgi:hypothetical protein
MKKLLSYFALIAFLSVSFLTAGHFHTDTETGCKADCPLCTFAQTASVASSVCTVAITPIILHEITAAPTENTVVADRFVLSDPRAPPSMV